jgi:hypothetical protein
VDVKRDHGSATEGEDYTFGDNFNFSAGETAKPYTFAAVGDDVPEWTEDADYKLIQDADRYRVYGTTDYDMVIYDNDLHISDPPSVMWVDNDDDNQNGVPDNVDSMGGGDNDLYELDLTVPQGSSPGANVILYGPSGTRFYQNADRTGWSATGIKVWNVGQGDTVPAHVFVQITAASAAVGDAYFTLQDGDTGGTEVITQSSGGTRYGVSIHNNVGNPVSNTVPQSILVGQRVDLSAWIDGPADKTHATYNWTVPGNILRDWFPGDDGKSYSIPLGNDDVVTVPPLNDQYHVGKQTDRVQFFWYDAALPGPEDQTVSVNVTIPGLTVPPPRAAKFRVYSPTVTANAAAHGTYQISADTTGSQYMTTQNPPFGILVGASVQQPAGGGFPAGNWSFLQLTNSNDEYDHFQNNGTIDRYLYSRNGAYTLDGPSFPLPAASNIILDPNNNLQPVANNPLTTGNAVFDWGDNPSALLSTAAGGDVLIPGTQDDLHEIHRNSQFKLYIMYLPPGDDSRWVPVKLMNWSFAFDIKDLNKNGLWTIVSITNPSDTGWTIPTAEPAWNATWQSGSWEKQ